MEKFVITMDDPDLSLDSLLSSLHADKMGKNQKLIDDITAMHQAAVKIARPVALYAPLAPEMRDGVVWLNGVKIENTFVYEKLSDCGTVIPYVASCGREIDKWSEAFTANMLEQFIADTIKELCYRAVRDKLDDCVREKYFDADKSASTLNPGSLPQWPISAQQPLFEILGGVTGDIGVELLDSMLMKPTKSTSGIIFQTDEPYHNCQLCPKTDCPSRAAPYSGMV